MTRPGSPLPTIKDEQKPLLSSSYLYEPLTDVTERFFDYENACAFAGKLG